MNEGVLGYQVSTGNVENCAREILHHVGHSPDQACLACLNPHSYVLALRDSVFSDALHAVNWLLPDGVGIVLASRVLGGNIHRRITGSDIFFEVCAQMDIGGGRVFFLGASEEVLAAIRDKVRREYPNIVVVGTYAPPFRDTFSKPDVIDMCSSINAAGADILWVGLGAPKQEKWVFQNLNLINVPFVASVGAVFDFYAGTVKRPHPIFQSLGLEWLPRLIREPGRLWPRMVRSAPVFICHVLRERFQYRRAR